MSHRHSLLKRQIKRYLGEEYPLSGQMQQLIQAVDDAYHQFDADRAMLERSLEMSSQELLQANSEMRTVFQAIPDLFFRLDQDGTILDFRASTPAGHHPFSTDLVGKRIHDIPWKEAAARFEEALVKVRESRTMVSIEYALDLKGQRQCYEARVLPMLESQVIAIVRNITERKQIEEERLKISKLDSISLLAAGIAHDFNNLLAVIIGNLSITKENTRPIEPVYETLSNVEAAAHRAKKLVRQLLAFSGNGMAVRKATIVGSLLRESATFALSGSNVGCTFSIAVDLHPILADEGQIGQVIDNLVINAKQAMPGGGTIHIAAENAVVEEGDDCRIPIVPGKYVKIVVSDEGAGIPQEHLSRIFDPYFTTKQAGTGLGLAVAYSIVKRHDGHIAVKSEVGSGTSFTIFLPALLERTGLVTPRDTMPERGRGRVLVMDDEETVRRTTGKMLERLGYTVGFAECGEEALDAYAKARQAGQPFDAIIADLTVPGGMGGKEAVRELLKLDPDVRAIISSGYLEEAVTADFTKWGFCGILAKPYDVHELAEALQAVLRGAPRQARLRHEAR